MSDDLPEIALTTGDGGWAVVYAGHVECTNVADLMEHAPALFTPENATLCAKAVNHLAHEQTYKVIEDPQAFITWHDTRITGEDLEEDWLPDHGERSAVDLSDIAPPSIGLLGLQFFAFSRASGVPYRVTSALESEALSELEYLPLDAELPRREPEPDLAED